MLECGALKFCIFELPENSLFFCQMRAQRFDIFLRDPFDFLQFFIGSLADLFDAAKVAEKAAARSYSMLSEAVFISA